MARTAAILGYFGPRLEANTTFRYGAFVDLFGSLWCELAERQSCNCGAYIVAMAVSGARADAMMGRLCAPIDYFAEQFAVMAEIRDSIINDLFSTMSTNLPPWYRILPRDTEANGKSCHHVNVDPPKRTGWGFISDTLNIDPKDKYRVASYCNDSDIADIAA
ncbi:hypothetical protein INT43_006821 [Umbelopsis isabellina]|uniref:Uncharacterized protein n=1 Tax=Mortierella isabellina TaxID=91625 RepID=A0A8H7Q1Y2_MORIS|nr:hypothetical protein INT43_006821 [Umbelopsis isabellina]